MFLEFNFTIKHIWDGNLMWIFMSSLRSHRALLHNHLSFAPRPCDQTMSFCFGLECCRTELLPNPTRQGYIKTIYKSRCLACIISNITWVCKHIHPGVMFFQQVMSDFGNWSRRAWVRHTWWRTKRSWPLFSPTFFSYEKKIFFLGNFYFFTKKSRFFWVF